MIINILLAVLLISVLIIVHEFGHFLAARANGVAVLEFAIGFGPHLLKHRHGDTDYCINAIPFGGYCMMLGADDAEEDGTGEVSEEETGEEELTDRDVHTRELLKKYGSGARLSDKSVGVRISIAFAGPLFNFLLAFVLAVLVIGHVGVDRPVIGDVADGSPAQQAGLEAEDVIKSINGQAVTFARDYDFYISYHGSQTLVIRYDRDGSVYETTVSPERQEEQVYRIGITLQSDGTVSSVTEDSPADRAGIKSGDIIRKVGDTDVTDGNSAVTAIREAGGNSVAVQVERNGELLTVSVTPQLTTSVGYYTGISVPGTREKVGPLATIAASAQDVWYWCKAVVQSIGMMFTGQVTVNDLSGPVGIVQTVNQVVNASRPDGVFYVIMNLLYFTEAISANLGVMNLLPLPGLDGGKILILIIEAVRRKPMKKEHEGMVQMVGMVFLFALSIYVLFHDITRLF
ncbi:MAG: RIP metalloprotease RseP [Lachnospiraceae bacterium]|jgi:regulator of sigma E protease|nr:RIP metalloprotease RseP [Lachnospiraceae bacterium]MCH4030652.1 RIP metalloprotease RseP [Lachnospiraceae bacterium]MCH4069861.1 RIP metalloprotease RseP [Lachnospiraceae bacterium]MCH4107200.1 RIP metalloprotease RseP [Lachnospiraceae bacterium]MCI1301945.1 RIP metalloprotease RseP [Lachnospiraceae bacterium]